MRIDAKPGQPPVVKLTKRELSQLSAAAELCDLLIEHCPSVKPSAVEAGAVLRELLTILGGDDGNE